MPPILPVIAAAIAGIVGAKFVEVSSLVWWSGFGILVLLGVLFRRTVWVIFLSIFFLAGLRYQLTAERLNQDVLAHYNDSTIGAQIRILDDPVRSENGYRALAEIGRTPVLLVSSFELSRHEVLSIKAKVEALPPQLNFYQEKGVHHQLELVKVIAIKKNSNGLDRIRSALSSWTKNSLASPYNGIALGILLGNHREIPRDILQEFRVTGTYHLLVASGLKVSLVAFAVLGLTWFFPLSKRLWVTAAAVCLYACLIGPDPPILRAMTMALFGLIGFLLGRGRESWNAFLLSLLVLIFIFPQWVFDLGFQLSFLSVLGILIFYEKICSRIAFLPKWLKDSVSLTLSAQLLIIIPLASEFHNLSFVSPLANLLTVPLTALSMALGTFSFLVHYLWNTGGYFLSDLNQDVLQLMLWIIEKSSRLPFAYRWVPSPGIWTILLTYSLFLSLWFWKERFAKTLFTLNLFGFFILGIHAYCDSMKPHIAANEDASLISIHRKNILINGGRRLLPFLESHGINRLDAIFLTDSRINHLRGLPAVIENFPVGEIDLPRIQTPSKTYRSFICEALTRHIPVHFINEKGFKENAWNQIVKWGL